MATKKTVTVEVEYATESAPGSVTINGVKVGEFTPDDTVYVGRINIDMESGEFGEELRFVPELKGMKGRKDKRKKFLKKLKVTEEALKDDPELAGMVNSVVPDKYPQVVMERMQFKLLNASE